MSNVRGEVGQQMDILNTNTQQNCIFRSSWCEKSVCPEGDNHTEAMKI